MPIRSLIMIKRGHYRLGPYEIKAAWGGRTIWETYDKSGTHIASNFTLKEAVAYIKAFGL